jgi:allantoin racemase
MPEAASRYRFCFIPAFTMPENSRFVKSGFKSQPKEIHLMNFDMHKHLLEDIEWDMHPGALAPYGDWPVENRQEFCLVASAKLPIIHEVCESGKYNAIILLGRDDPGFFESSEITRKFNIPVTVCLFSQIHIASMLGDKFSIIDISAAQNMFYYNLVVKHHFAQRCASIRNINYPLPRPGFEENLIFLERDKALRGESSEAVERAVSETVAAIQDEGAEVIIFGCSAAFWLKPFLQKRLTDMG